MNNSAKQTIADLIENRKAIRVGANAVFGFLAVGTRGYVTIVGSTSPKSGRSPLGIILRETMERHPDSLSVTGGIWQHSTDSDAPTHKWVWVTTSEGGEPDLTKLCRDNGGLDKLTRGFGI